MEIASIGCGVHLGDLCAILLLLHNRSLKSLIPIGIFAPIEAKILLGLFGFQLEYLGENHENSPRESISTLMDERFKNPKTKFLSDMYFKWISKKNITPGETVNLPDTLFEPQKKRNELSFQMDIRSFHSKKRQLTEKEMKTMILKFNKCGLKPIGIGGPETKPYLNHEFRTGRLEEIVKNLSCSVSFLGCDSGISHLAGILGIPGNVIITHHEKQDYEELEMFYKTMYPSLKIHHRYVLEIKMI